MATAALDGQGLLEFIDQEDYSAANSDDEDPDPPKLKSSRPPSPSPSEELVSDTDTLPPATSDADDDQADAAAQPKTGHASSEAPSDSSSGNSPDATGVESKSTKPSTKISPKHLRTETVKEGTVLPANFAIIERKPRDNSNPFPIQHQRTQQRSHDRQRQAPRNDNSFKAPDIYDRFGNPVSFNDLQRK
ncbi:hypothetical protein PR002_g22185 [Phytophthora rubi]|uniref:Uncharacterized protein n=1 Tax=Phytophthora rubi TaxID=129364 RepID=A0A6A3IYN3_9STRA|nr:hypothetical protein PR002_g22185 [Phytophthora rubi]